TPWRLTHFLTFVYRNAQFGSAFLKFDGIAMCFDGAIDQFLCNREISIVINADFRYDVGRKPIAHESVTDSHCAHTPPFLIHELQLPVRTIRGRLRGRLL